MKSDCILLQRKMTKEDAQKCLEWLLNEQLYFIEKKDGKRRRTEVLRVAT